MTRQIRGCKITDEQYNRLQNAQNEHDKKCEDAWQIYLNVCKISQICLDNVWEEICKENQVGISNDQIVNSSEQKQEHK